jgi:hypothetical protein
MSKGTDIDLISVKKTDEPKNHILMSWDRDNCHFQCKNRFHLLEAVLCWEFNFDLSVIFGIVNPQKTLLK